MQLILLTSVFAIATCGLVYELIAGALASYLLGDSVTQFSTVIGTYLFSMGIGSWFSKYFKKNLLSVFIQVELIIAIVGGFSAAILFSSFEFITQFRLLLYSLVVITGALVGLEIPLLMRILKDKLEFTDLVSKVFTFDYIGALIASLLFPLVLVPQLGLIRTGFFFGIINASVAFWALTQFKDELEWPRLLKFSSIFVLLLLTLGFSFSNEIMSFAEHSAYQDPVIFQKNSPYQRIVLTKSHHDLKLFLNGNLQFSARDEYRYHESLVHVGMGTSIPKKRILILGGGDGLAAREVLKYPEVEEVTLVDLDPEMTRLFSTHTPLLELNQSALLNPKVKVINTDAYVWIRAFQDTFDFIVIDFPDPSSFSLGKLYTLSFFREIKRVLNPEGAFVVQSTSPFYAKKSFWIINQSISAAGFHTYPYHAYVPSFGEWGFILASSGKLLRTNYALPENLKFIRNDVIEPMFVFPQDMLAATKQVNLLNNQILVRTFEDEWSEFSHQ